MYGRGESFNLCEDESFIPYSAGIDFTDVYRRQILTTEVDPRAVRIKIFIMAVDPWHGYSNESERDNEHIYDDLKLKKTL